MRQKIYLFTFFILGLITTKSQNSIITKWNTNINNDNSTQLKIPAVGSFTYSYQNTSNPTIIGSGSGNTGNTTLSLPQSGEYMITILPSSSFKFNFGNSALLATDRKKITQLLQWGNVNWNSDLSNMFLACNNLQIIATDVPNFSGVTNMSGMFSLCQNTGDIPNINSWNVSNVTNFNSMFYSASNFNGNISNWNTINATDMVGMFRDAIIFNQNIGGWITTNVTNMTTMFSGAKAFNQNIGNWNTTNVTSMSSMFQLTDNFNQNIGNWNTANVTNMSAMFEYALAFNQNIGNWNTTNVTTMGHMFHEAHAFNQNLQNWNVSNVADLSLMFFAAYTFNQNLGSWLLNSNVDMTSMLQWSGINCVNYSNTLKGWSENVNTPTNRSLGATSRNYGSVGQIYRNNLINNKGWNITGDVYNASCDAVLSTTELSNKKLQIYPNPTNSDLFIRLENNEKIQIFNSVGLLLKTFELKSGLNKIDISKFNKGEYIFKMQSGSYKIIKE